MKSKLFLIAICWLLGSSLLFANNLFCGLGAPTIMADGSVLAHDSINPGSWSDYLTYLSAGHSYALEVWNPYGEDQTFQRGRPSVELWNSVGNSCQPASWTDVSGMNPALTSGFSGRISWIQASDALQYAAINNLDNVNLYFYNVRLIDTTLFNARWSTYSGFTTQWGFNNISNSSISGKLTIYGPTGNVLKTVNLSLPAGKVTFRNSGSGDLNLPVNNVGSAMFAFVGPAGAIQADAFMLNSNASVVVAAKFESRNAQF